MSLQFSQMPQLFAKGFTLSLMFSLLACTTVPDKAPKEYHLASAAIDRAQVEKADKAFPITIERAKNDLREALVLFDQSQQTNTPEPTRQAVARAGAEKAERAKSLAEKATDLHAQVNAWDQKIELKDQVEKSEAAVNVLQNKIVMMDEMANERMMADETLGSGMQDRSSTALQTNIKTPVAFFAADKTGVTDQFMDSIDSLASTLNNNPTLKVTLIGYADRTGQMTRNNRLAEERAENVAKALRSRGVMADQILIDSHGASMATASEANPAGLQLDRRVDALIGNRSGADMMTTGR